jgi:hypothetical protein
MNPVNHHARSQNQELAKRAAGSLASTSYDTLRARRDSALYETTRHAAVLASGARDARIRQFTERRPCRSSTSIPVRDPIPLARSGEFSSTGGAYGLGRALPRLRAWSANVDRHGLRRRRIGIHVPTKGRNLAPDTACRNLLIGAVRALG